MEPMVFSRVPLEMEILFETVLVLTSGNTLKFGNFVVALGATAFRFPVGVSNLTDVAIEVVADAAKVRVVEIGPTSTAVVEFVASVLTPAVDTTAVAAAATVASGAVTGLTVVAGPVTGTFGFDMGLSSGAINRSVRPPGLFTKIRTFLVLKVWLCSSTIQASTSCQPLVSPTLSHR